MLGAVDLLATQVPMEVRVDLGTLVEIRMLLLELRLVMR
jgi:hypothetical protein